MLRLLAILLLIASPALAQKAEDRLRITWREAIPDIDPYHNPLRTGLVVAHQAWDGLIERDPETLALRPLLATSWSFVDDTTLDLTLRAGVTFHNGDPFTADDVVYTIAQATGDDPLVAVPSNYSWIAGAERIDALHVRLHLRRVFPAALEYLALTLPILPKAYRSRVGPAVYSRFPVGAGPYRIARAEPNRIELERYDGYYKDSPKGRALIAHIAIREVNDPDSEINDLLAGRADWIWAYQPDRGPEILKNPNLIELRAESMRLGYLSMDAAGRSGAGNPMTVLKVRQAIEAAVDRATIAHTLVQGGARVPDAPCYPTQFGCDAAAAVHVDYDPARARRLLAEAGFPDGFDTTLVSYVLPQYTNAVAANLAAIGIRAKVEQLPLAQAIQIAADGQAPLFMGSWGSYSINDVSAILPYFFDGGDNDYARVPEVERLIEQAGQTIDADRRRAAYGAAIHLITAQALWLPLHTYVTPYAMTRLLNFKPTADELPRFYLASWR
jgi:peptide/nickel transport system substrate-binding protein